VRVARDHHAQRAVRLTHVDALDVDLVELLHLGLSVGGAAEHERGDRRREHGRVNG
jgi:hypothetical protein